MKLAAEKPDYLVENLFHAIEKGEYLVWNIYVQVRSPREAENYK